MTRFRIALVVLLVWAAYWAALPWIDCARANYSAAGLQDCTLSPHGLNIIVGIVFLVAAELVATRRRPM
jgi:hypothetical protein